MRSLLEQGGWVLLAIVALSLAAWFMIVWKWLQLRQESGGGLAWTRDALRQIHTGRLEKAAALCQSHPNLPGRLMLAALEADEPERSFFEKRLRPILESEAAMLRRHLDLIAVAAALLPLLGLLGTVLGMVVTFRALVAPTALQADGLAGGISQALVTTQAGLVAALPIIIAHRYLASRIRRFIDQTTLLVKNIETILCHG